MAHPARPTASGWANRLRAVAGRAAGARKGVDVRGAAWNGERRPEAGHSREAEFARVVKKWSPALTALLVLILTGPGLGLESGSFAMAYKLN